MTLFDSCTNTLLLETFDSTTIRIFLSLLWGKWRIIAMCYKKELYECEIYVSLLPDVEPDLW